MSVKYVKGILGAAPLLAQFVTGVSSSSISFKNSVVIEVATRDFRSIRGRSVACALLDETAFWHSDDSVNPDVEVLNAIIPAMATFGESGLSSAAPARMPAGASYGPPSTSTLAGTAGATWCGLPLRAL